MTIFQRKKIQEELARQNAKLDAGADNLLDRAKGAIEKGEKSPWTGAILLAVAVLIIIAAFSFIS